MLDPLPNPADPGAVQTFRTIDREVPTDLLSHSEERPCGLGSLDIVRLAALVQAAHALLSGGLHQQAQMWIEQLIAALDTITRNDEKVASAASFRSALRS